MMPASRAARRAVDGPRGSQAWQPVRVLQLQQLHRPLHVGDATRAEFGVLGRVGATRQPLGLHPCLELADLGQLGIGQAALGPAPGVDLRHQRRAEFVVAGQRVGPDERLQLPGGRPAAVVVAIRRQRPDQRTALAFRAQIGIDAQRRIGARAEPAAYASP